MNKEKEAHINENNPNKDKKTKPLTTSMNANTIKNMVISVIIVSFVVGGVSGLLFGTLASTNSEITTWIQKNILGQTSAIIDKDTGNETSTINESKTISVEENSATIDAVKEVSPAVVSIIITQDLSNVYNLTGPDVFPFDDIFDFNFPLQFDEPQGEQQVGAGTGFIISQDGLIMTNKHVVSTEGAKYMVLLNNGDQYEAQVIDTDPFNDIAIIKIEGSDLPVVAIGDSDTLEIGQTVIAIGNSLGQYSNTVTKGIVSGLSRTVTAGDGQGQSETLEDIVQTDAAINFGNSGGPLINLDGQVVGVNTAINREGQLIGFAIPINQAQKAIISVKESGRIVRPYIGVRYIVLNEEIANENNLTVDYGALIVRGSSATELAIIPGSPADKAGLTENDIILEVDGQRIDKDHSLAKQLQKYNPDDTVNLKVLQKGEEKTLQVTLAEVGD
ncbi:trypsin-like peptidase domain-containing protein [Patescibacteria group bacterium]|nr:trypsin-like peptidase domain-containing protein [Patescibacteria group bacterium]MBU0964136.1 trypsin-like peptidase domain-containing protein [Patescibacteria group bacterium]